MLLCTIVTIQQRNWTFRDYGHIDFLIWSHSSSQHQAQWQTFALGWAGELLTAAVMVILHSSCNLQSAIADTANISTFICKQTALDFKMSTIQLIMYITTWHESQNKSSTKDSSREPTTVYNSFSVSSVYDVAWCVLPTVTRRQRQLSDVWCLPSTQSSRGSPAPPSTCQLIDGNYNLSILTNKQQQGTRVRTPVRKRTSPWWHVVRDTSVTGPITSAANRLIGEVVQSRRRPY